MLLAPSLVIGGLASVIILHQGFYDRFSNETVLGEMAFSHLDKNKCPSLLNLGCVGGETSSKEMIMLYGNSHAEHYFDFFDKYAKQADYKLELVATGGCGIANNSKKCGLINDYFTTNVHKADIVVISQRWDTVLAKDKQLYLDKLEHLIHKIKDDNKIVILMAQTPKWSSSISKLWNCSRVFGKCNNDVSLMNDFKEYNMLMRRFALLHNVLFWEPYSNIKNNETPFDSLNRPLFFDDNHLSRYGGQFMFENFSSLSKQEMRNILYSK